MSAVSLRCQGQEREYGRNALLRKSRKLHIIIVAQDIPWGGGGTDRVQQNKNLFFLPCSDLVLHWQICFYI